MEPEARQGDEDLFRPGQLPRACRAVPPRSTVWVCFRGVPVRCYDHSVRLGPETEYGVAIGKLARVSRQPLALGRASLAGLRAATPWFTAS